MMSSRSTVFFSSRTLPFQRAFCRNSSAAGVKRCGRRLFSRLKRSAKCRTSAGMSSRRSRSGGTRIGMTLRRKYRSSRNVPFSISGFEILVRRRDDADVHLDRPRRPEPLDLPFLQHAQDLGLRLRAHVADFVEEDRAAVGLLELADLLLGRAGERALLVAEQLRLDQLLGNRGAVHLHEPLAAAQAVAVDRARDELLAGRRSRRAAARSRWSAPRA